MASKEEGDESTHRPLKSTIENFKKKIILCISRFKIQKSLNCTFFGSPVNCYLHSGSYISAILFVYQNCPFQSIFSMYTIQK